MSRFAGVKGTLAFGLALAAGAASVHLQAGQVHRVVPIAPDLAATGSLASAPALSSYPVPSLLRARLQMRDALASRFNGAWSRERSFERVQAF